MKVGDTVTFRDCYGSNPRTGTIIKRYTYSSEIKVGRVVSTVPDCLIDGLSEGKAEADGKHDEKQLSLI